MADALLAKLNEAQRDAVSSTAQQLAILAGPGSGKTHTLTSRVAWFLKSGIRPENIIVATFTRKAALEMKDRIEKLLGDERGRKLILGTFHSIALKYLYAYGNLIKMRKGFAVIDSNDSFSIIKRIIKRKNLTCDPKSTASRISTRKAKGAWDEKLVKAMKYDVKAQQTEIVYTEYEDALKRDNLLDFDDLLVRCVELLRTHPECVANIDAVLIDEFQDTNLVQFDLMRLMAARKKRVTVVGDPDQSIYGFRSAEVKNYASLIKQYPDTLTISLEENYRSSPQILEAAMAVIQQDESRIKKTLKPTHVSGTKPVLRTLSDADVEGDWIAMEIKRCLALSANLMTYNDVAILVRSSYLSRCIENGFIKAGIPYRMVGGHAFYNRQEVKIILNYMHVINNPTNNEAFTAVVNEPKRGVGDVTVEKLMAEATKRRISIWEMFQKGPMTLQLSTTAKNGVSKFIAIINDARNMIKNDDSPSILGLMEWLITTIGLETYLMKLVAGDIDKFEDRMANVKELKAIAMEVDASTNLGNYKESLPEVEGLQQNDISTPLSDFLVNISLATDKRAKDAEGENTPRVTISTMHSAKGLEWPIVFVPGCYEGGVPNSRGAEENMDEERRIFYVAMTRAKVLLYLSHPRQRSNPQQGMEQVPLSNFLKPANLKIYFAKRGPLFHDDVVQNIASILRLPVPNVIIPDENIQLLSHEDDILPEDGRGEKQPPRWDNDDRTYRPGQRLGGLERPQLSDRKSDGSFKPSYTTTMQSMSGFSSAKNVLEQQPVNVSFIARSKRDSGLLEEEEDDDDYFPERPTKKRGASLENGQRRMQDFLGGGAGNSAPKPTSTRGFKGDYPKKGPNAVPFQRTTYASKKPVPVATAATYNLPSIDPSLRQHRIGSNTLPATRRAVRPVTPPAYTNAYINIISSSPQKPSAENAVPVIDLTAEPDLPPLAVPKLQGRQTTMSSTSFHNTTVDRLGAKNGKRTLGVKRSMNGWANRKGAGDPKPLAYKVTPSVRADIDSLMGVVRDDSDSD